MKQRCFATVLIIVLFSVSSVSANPVDPDASGPSDLSSWTPLIIVVASITIVGLVVLYVVSKKRKPTMESERIEFNVAPDNNVVVKGSYLFEHLTVTNGKSRIFYPLPNSSDSLIGVQIDGSDKGVSLTPSSFSGYNGYLISFNASGKSTTTLAITYTQQSPENTCRYILLSTRHWKKPVGKAVFIIRTPVGMVLSDCSRRYVEQGLVNGNHEYEITEKKLWPEQDLEFAWKQ